MPQEEIEFGVVRIIAGKHAGTLAYYDDDGERGCLVYIGVPHEVEPLEVPKRHLRAATPDEKIAFEMAHLAGIDPAFRDHFGLTP